MNLNDRIELLEQRLLHIEAWTRYHYHNIKGANETDAPRISIIKYNKFIKNKGQIIDVRQ